MKFLNFLVNNKAKLFYIVVVLLFNIAAGVYLLSFSTISLPTIQIPNFGVVLADAKQKLSHVFVFPTPTPKDAVKYALPKENAAVTPTLTTAPTATTSAELIDCIGPDGKHISLTQNDCDNFNNSWKITPQTITTPEQASSAANIN